MRKWIALLAVMALLGCVLVPGVSFTEDRSTVLLARAIYALARDASYDAKLAIGSRYDADSLAAAHEVLSGRRTLAADALYYQIPTASQPRSDKPVAEVAGFKFYRS